MAHEHNLHIMPEGDGWKIVAPGQDAPVAVTATQEEAITLATRMQYNAPTAGKSSSTARMARSASAT